MWKLLPVILVQFSSIQKLYFLFKNDVCIFQKKIMAIYVKNEFYILNITYIQLTNLILALLLYTKFKHAI